MLNSWNDLVENYMDQQEIYKVSVTEKYRDYLYDKVTLPTQLPDSTYTKWKRTFIESENKVRPFSLKIV